MLLLILLNLFFLLGQALPGRFNLALKKLRNVSRFLLPQLLILVDEQIGQLACNLLGDVRIMGRINNIE